MSEPNGPLEPDDGAPAAEIQSSKFVPRDSRVPIVQRRARGLRRLRHRLLGVNCGRTAVLTPPNDPDAPYTAKVIFDGPLAKPIRAITEEQNRHTEIAHRSAKGGF